ncbi:MAG TPA: DUF4010 domain-containing protein [Candidatus Norongarragalinales archaeon]|nr:DUF4010 domain-containing protein [Candidatus Norongarragalinales archaeon]
MEQIILSLLEKLLISIAIGAIVGLEREHTKKQTLLGIRTFSLISLTGMLLTELSRDNFYILSAIGLIGIFALTISFYFFKATHFKNSIGLTTIVLLPLTYILGMLISFNYILEAIATTVIVTYFLIEKGQVHHLVERISRREIVDFLIFIIIAFVVYPLVPESIMLWGHPISLQQFILTVILISALSFLSHVIARVIKHNAVLYATFFGGLVSSLATVMLFARDRKVSLDALKLSFTSSSAGSIVRDFLLLMALNLALFRSALLMFAVPVAGFLLLTQYYARNINLAHFKFMYNRPISLFFVLKFAAVLFLVTNLTDLMFDISSRTLFYASLFLAGAVNSASVIASVAFLFSAGKLPEDFALNGMFLGLLGSALAKIAVASQKAQWENMKYISFLVALSLALLTIGFLVSKIYAF